MFWNISRIGDRWPLNRARSDYAEVAAYSLFSQGMRGSPMVLFSRVGSPFAVNRAVVSVLASNNRGHAHDCANRTSLNAFRVSRSSARISAVRPSERVRGSQPRCVLGRPSDAEMLDLLLWTDALFASVRGTPSARSPPGGPISHSLIFFLWDGREIDPSLVERIVSANFLRATHPELPTPHETCSQRTAVTVGSMFSRDISSSIALSSRRNEKISATTAVLSGWSPSCVAMP